MIREDRPRESFQFLSLPVRPLPASYRRPSAVSQICSTRVVGGNGEHEDTKAKGTTKNDVLHADSEYCHVYAWAKK